jgi:hypothetical protein
LNASRVATSSVISSGSLPNAPPCAVEAASAAFLSEHNIAQKAKERLRWGIELVALVVVRDTRLPAVRPCLRVCAAPKKRADGCDAITLSRPVQRSLSVLSKGGGMHKRGSVSRGGGHNRWQVVSADCPWIHSLRTHHGHFGIAADSNQKQSTEASGSR